ncbi:MAG: hypothetical protein DRI57_32155 [Deltaproteobacteria bacterium]|nr:MAG: hypothetical protein DRI57_32155 [Deltaproteobacteria bacterium]
MASPLLEKGDSEYKIYDALVENWLDRDQYKDKNISVENLLYACIILATYMQTKGRRSISEQELDQLIGAIDKVKPVRRIQIKGRSLLNRNSEGDYRFSHYSIQEFLVAKLLLEKPVYKPKQSITMTDFIFKMVLMSEKLPNFGELLDFSNITFKNFAGTCLTTGSGWEFVYIPPGEFMMGSPESEARRYDNETLHRVTLTRGFYMQTTQVTQRQWKAVMGNNPSKFKKGDEYPHRARTGWAWRFFCRRRSGLPVGVPSLPAARLPGRPPRFSSREGSTLILPFGFLPFEQKTTRKTDKKGKVPIPFFIRLTGMETTERMAWAFSLSYPLSL